jgi:hypothetical protein
VEEELHHVVLGEELGNGGELIGSDLHPGFIDLILSLLLPELVGPAEGIIRREDLGREFSQKLSEEDLIALGQGDLEDGIIRAEDSREDFLSESAGEVEAILGPQLVSQLLAIREGHRDIPLILVGMEESILSQEAGEEEAVPVLVGGILGEVLDLLSPLRRIELISQGAASGAEAIAQLALLHAHVSPVLLLMHGEILERSTASLLGCLTGIERDAR